MEHSARGLCFLSPNRISSNLNAENEISSIFGEENSGGTLVSHLEQGDRVRFFR